MTQPDDPEPLTLEWVQAEKAKHRAALADLDVVERVILSKRQSQPALDAAQPAPLPIPPEGFGTKKRAMLMVIANSPTGLTTAETLQAILVSGVPDAKRENVAPQLSSFKKHEEYLILEDGRWKITDKGRDYLARSKS